MLGILPIAVKFNQNIIVDAAVSSQLLYNIQTSIEPMYQKIFKKNGPIQIKVRKKERINFNGTGVATGCSLGVDSLSAIYHHLESDMVDSFKLTHLTLFNSGQLGDYDLEATEKNFFDTVREITPFADSLNLPILAINSNLNYFYKDSGIYVIQTVELRTMAFALSVQKLIKYYIYGSCYPINKIKFDDFDIGHQQAALLPLLSTENFIPILGDPYSTRVDKTLYIKDKPLVSKYLKVCWAEQTAFEIWHNTSFLEGKTKTNCGWCDKCLRTLLSLEILNNGNLNDFKEQFELGKYYQHRNAYISKIFTHRKQNVFYQEMVDLIIQNKYPIQKSILRKYYLQIRVEALMNKIVSIISKIKNMIFSILTKIKRRIFE